MKGLFSLQVVKWLCKSTSGFGECLFPLQVLQVFSLFISLPPFWVCRQESLDLFSCGSTAYCAWSQLSNSFPGSLMFLPLSTGSCSSGRCAWRFCAWTHLSQAGPPGDGTQPLQPLPSAAPAGGGTQSATPPSCPSHRCPQGHLLLVLVLPTAISLSWAEPCETVQQCLGYKYTLAAQGERDHSQHAGIHGNTVKKQTFIKDSNVSFKLPKGYLFIIPKANEIKLLKFSYKHQKTDLNCIFIRAFQQ